MFVEAVLHPWNLFLTESEKKYSTKVSLKQQREDAGTANDPKDVNKRLKIDDPSRRVEGSSIACDSDQSSCGFSGCCACYKVPNEEQKCCNLSLHRISCIATIRSSDHRSQYIGFLQNTRTEPNSGGGSRLSAQKILLEIRPENFSKYQVCINHYCTQLLSYCVIYVYVYHSLFLYQYKGNNMLLSTCQFLQIGSFYITKRNNNHSLFNMEESNCVNSQKFLITSCTQLWCISFTFGNDILHGTESNNTQFSDFPICDGGVISGDQIDLHCRSLSDIYLHLPANAKDSLVFDLEKQEENSTKLVIKPEEAGKPCYRDGISSDMQTSGFHGTDCLFPEGNLSSVKGHVVAVHDLHQSCIDSNLECQSIKGGLCRFPVGGKSTCIHLLMEDQIVCLAVPCSLNFVFLYNELSML